VKLCKVNARPAFCHSDSSGTNRSHMARALMETAKHLAGQELTSNHHKDLLDFARDLSIRDSHHLQRATTEALAFIAYLRRFAGKDLNKE
jgi:hypothetical protein